MNKSQIPWECVGSGDKKPQAGTQEMSYPGREKSQEEAGSECTYTCKHKGLCSYWTLVRTHTSTCSRMQIPMYAPIRVHVYTHYTYILRKVH